MKDVFPTIDAGLGKVVSNQMNRGGHTYSFNFELYATPPPGGDGRAVRKEMP